MKRAIQICVAVSIFLGLSLLTGCNKEGFGNKDFKTIKFTSATYNKLSTRTQYGDYDSEDSPTKQSIYWSSEDKIRIYSPDAARRVAVEAGEAESEWYRWADYEVYPQEDRTLGQLMNINNDGGYTQEQVGENGQVGNGLIWIEDKSTFYGIYPSPETSESKGLNLDGVSGKFSLNIPSAQDFSIKGDMDYAYMTAAIKGAEQGTNPILKFHTQYTAFEISVKSASDALALSSFKLSSETMAIAGAFTVTTGFDSNDAATFTCTTTSTEKEITVDLTNQSAPASTAAQPLVFTVFALPKDLSGLSVSFTLANGVVRTLKLNDNVTESDKVGTPINFEGRYKHRIYGLFLPNGELMINVDTAPWLAGGIHTFTTIEDVTTVFLSYKRYNEDHNYGSGSWSLPNYIAIAPGRSATEQVNPDDPESALTNLPLHSPMITMTTVSVGVPLQLRSDNPIIGFVVADEQGIYPISPSPTLDIRASGSLTDVVTTTYFVVPVDDTVIGETANISLIRTDTNTPIAFSHSDMPGTTDHTKVPYIVLSEGDYNNDSVTHVEIPSI